MQLGQGDKESQAQHGVNADQGTSEIEALVFPTESAPTRQHSKPRYSTQKSSVTPEEWQERLKPYSEGILEAIEHTNFSNTRTPASKLNSDMLEALGNKHELPRIATWVRCKLLTMPVAEYAAELGIGDNTARRLEREAPPKDTRVQRDHYTNIINGWRRLGSGLADGEKQALIEKAIDEFSAHLPGVNSNSTFGILNRWRYLTGQRDFEEVIGCSYKALWARQKANQFYSFKELLGFAHNLGIISRELHPIDIQKEPAFIELQRAWLKDCASLKRSVAMAKIHVYLALAEIGNHQSALHEHPQILLPLRESKQIARFRPVSWRRLEPVITHLKENDIINKDNKLQKLQKELANERSKQADSFEGSLRKICHTRGIDNRMLADAFDLRTQTSQKPVLPIYRALRYGEYGAKTPAGTFALLLAPTNEIAVSLLNKKRDEIREDLKRKQSGIVSPVYVERILWKVELKDLPYPKAALQELEWRPQLSNLSQKEVLHQILTLGLKKAHDVLSRFHSLRNDESVTSAVSSLIYLRSGKTLEVEAKSSSIRLKSISLGEEVPPLPMLKRILDSQSMPLSAKLERDWYDSFAKYYAGDNHSDLERLLWAHVYSKHETLGEYHKANSVDRNTCAHIFSALYNSGVISAKDLDVLIEKLKIPDPSPFSTLLRTVHEFGSVSAALPSFIDSLELSLDRTAINGIAALRKVLTQDKRRDDKIRKNQLPLKVLIQENQNPHQQQALSPKEERAMECRRALPGLTTKEILNIHRVEHQRQKHLIPGLIRKAHERGLSDLDLGFCLMKTHPTTRQALRLTMHALESGTQGPLTAPGVIANLVSHDEDEKNAWLEHSRKCITERFNTIGVRPRNIQVEMVLWGVRTDELEDKKSTLGNVLWTKGTRNAHTQRVLKEVQTIGATKTAAALDRLTELKRAQLTPEVCKVLLDRDPAGTKGLALRAHIPLGIAVSFAEARNVPTLPQLRRIAAATDFNITDQHLLGWHFSSALYLEASIKNPLHRFVTHLALSREGNISHEGLKVSNIERALRLLLIETELDTPENRGILRNPDRDPVAHWKTVSSILSALGHNSSSPCYDFAYNLFLHNDMREAFKGWGKAMNAVDTPFPNIDPLLKYCSSFDRPAQNKSEQHTLESLFKLKESCLNGHSEHSYSDILDLAQIFYGARAEDLISLSKSAHIKEVFGPLYELSQDNKQHDKNRSKTDKEKEVAAKVKGIREKALIDRRRSELQAKGIILAANEVEAEAGREIEVTNTIEKLFASGGIRANGTVTHGHVDNWCAVLGEPGLAQRYQSLYISTMQPSGGRSPEEAFVRKFIELCEKLNRWKSSTESSDFIKGTHALHVN